MLNLNLKIYELSLQTLFSRAIFFSVSAPCVFALRCRHLPPPSDLVGESCLCQVDLFFFLLCCCHRRHHHCLPYRSVECQPSSIANATSILLSLSLKRFSSSFSCSTSASSFFIISKSCPLLLLLFA